MDDNPSSSGWKVGYVENFYEDDAPPSTKIKMRTLVAPEKTGAFNLISKLCDLFEAKPIFHGDTKTVDIIHMNPFSEPTDGGLPDVANADGVFELHYGKNIKSVTKTLNTDNIVTRLYAYGSFGDAVNKYCGIENLKHNEYNFIWSGQTIPRDTECMISAEDSTGVMRNRYFTVTNQYGIVSGTVIIWSDLDQMSLSYAWNDRDYIAYKLYDTQQGDNSPVVIPYSETKEVENYVSSLLNFGYYEDAGLFTDTHRAAVARYQRNIGRYLSQVNDASQVMSNENAELASIIGSVDYVKLKNPVFLDEQVDEKHFTQIVYDGIEYTTEYMKKEKDWFKWRKAEGFLTNGDSKNGDASVIYIVRMNADPMTFDKFYFTADGEMEVGGETKKYLRINKEWVAGYFGSDAEVFLFSSNNTNGNIGAAESNYLTTLSSLKDSTKDGTTEHPTYFVLRDSNSSLPEPGQNSDWYGWGWVHDPDLNNCEWLFSTAEHDNRAWVHVYYGSVTPASPVNTMYFYNWREKVLYYHGNGITGWKKYESSGEKRVANAFGIVLNACMSFNQSYYGLNQQYTYMCPDNLVQGNYAFMSPYGTFWCFTTTEQVSYGHTLIYDTTYKDVQVDSYATDKVGYKVETKGFTVAEFHPTNAAENVRIYDNTWINTDGNDVKLEGWYATHFVRALLYGTESKKWRTCSHYEWPLPNTS